MSAVTRDEFETVKDLLVSAARYAESANKGLERLEMSQQRTQLQIDQLALKVDQLAESQKRTQEQLDYLSVRVTQMSERVDTFVSTAQHYFSKHGESIDQLKGISERLEGILAYLVRRDSNS